MTQLSSASRAPFSASDAAFAGFGILKRRPSTLAVWGGLMLVFGLVTQVGMVTMIGPQMMALRGAAGTSAPADPAQIGQMFARFIPFWLIAMVASLVLLGVISAAVNRALLRPGEGGPGYLAFGADEFLQIAVAFLYFLLLSALYIALLIAIVVIGGVGFAAASAGGGRAGGGLVAGVLVLVGIPATLCAFIWLNVRLSFALPLTFDTRQLHLFGSFALTRGRFWALFGAYLLSWILAIVITLVYLVVIAAVSAAVGGGLAGLGQLFQRDTSSFGSFFTPVALIALVLGPFVQALQWALLAAAPASAYAQLRPNRLAEVF